MTDNTQRALVVGEHIIPVAPDLPILDQLLLKGIPVEYQCRGGFCGACRMRLKNGEVRYLDTPIAYINDGEVLTCCSVAVSRIVELEADYLKKE
ncbi:class I ribonucleotide reductase maintenance protein YfaE [Gallaecimonas pentaromativorans]|uniref:Ferredoxin n=1 Tax=Gallaecimonas pentaromativorans TaxID=584787 RepID=A0A3N1PQM3_9GAMM|nr:class I ribonucleotide reductase maintenance protein YfaE [Gallaecimonas pentaromativorans]MED5523318.1 class I ribonucleotide reductase maintenance protein YfaE [Pseudomonadota bacterium]ROQ30509.1 ferredoxin [Gallaecimonas pentaromativorans]